MTLADKSRIFLFGFICWLGFVVIRYSLLLGDLSSSKSHGIYLYAREFFGWQIAGFFLLGGFVSMVRPARLGRSTAVYLGASTVAFLTLSRESYLPALLAVFLLWCFLSLSSLRLALRSIFGPEMATWGVAGGVLFSALIPISFVLGILHWITIWTVGAVALLLIVPGVVDLQKSWRGKWRSLAAWLDGLNGIGAASLGVLWLVFSLAIVWADSPEVSPDSSRVYLPQIEQIATSNGFVVQFIDFYHMLVRGLLSVHAMAFLIGSYPLVKLLSWSALPFLAILIAEEATRRSRMQNAGVLAAAVITTCPLLLQLGGTLYHDHTMTLLFVTSFIVLFRSEPHRFFKGAVLSAAVMSSLLQTKYSALIFGIVWAGCLAILSFARYRSGHPRAVYSFALVALCFAVFSCPFYVYTYFHTGNPVYPFFDHWFDSPHWPDNQAFGQSDVAAPGFEGGVVDVLTLPWHLTFESSLFIPGTQGLLGFQLLALAPFLLVLILDRDRQRTWGVGLVLASAASLLGLGLYSYYARLWLPAYPLLLLPLLVAASRVVVRCRWPPSPLVTWLAGLLAFAVLMMTVPPWTTELPWSLYTKRVSKEEWLTAKLSEYPAITQLNEFVEPRDRVLLSKMRGVYLVDADAYAFPFWKANIALSGRFDNLARFLRSHAIRYWAISYSENDLLFFENHAAAARYWQDSRLVAASSTVAIYDVSDAASVRGFEVAEHRSVPPSLLPPTTRGHDGLDRSAWQDLSKQPNHASRLSNGTIDLPARGRLALTFTVTEGSELCRATFELEKIARGRSAAIVNLQWFDEEWKRRGVQRASIPVASGRQIFGTVPDGTSYGQYILQGHGGKGLALGETNLDCGRIADR